MQKLTAVFWNTKIEKVSHTKQKNIKLRYLTMKHYQTGWCNTLKGYTSCRYCSVDDNMINWLLIVEMSWQVLHGSFECLWNKSFVRLSVDNMISFCVPSIQIISWRTFSVAHSVRMIMKSSSNSLLKNLSSRHHYKNTPSSSTIY